MENEGRNNVVIAPGIIELAAVFNEQEVPFLLFKAICVHDPQGAKTAAVVMIQWARHKKIRHVALVGGCDDVTDFSERELRNTVESAGIAFARIDDSGLAEYEISKYLLATEYKISIDSWQDALFLQSALPHLHVVTEAIRNLSDTLAEEAKLLADFPIVCCVEGFEFHPDANRSVLGSGFSSFFGHISDVRSRRQLVALFDIQVTKGVFVCDGSLATVPFHLPEWMMNESIEVRKNRIIDGSFTEGRSSLRVKMGGSDVEFSLYLCEGEWSIKPHKVINPRDPRDLSYVPIFHRLKLISAIC